MLGFSPCGNPVVGMYMWFKIVLLLRASLVLAVLPPEPSFAEPIQNITITAGRDARLQCVVDNLGVHRVAWIKVDTQTVLTLHTLVITHNSRISINHNGHRNWDLHIKQIQEVDRGLYMCQVNASPMKSQVGNIEVVVPPDIISDETSSDFAMSEGSTANLLCHANGYPPPKLSWRREDGEPIFFKTVDLDRIGVYTTEGEILTLPKVTRKNMGAYLCIASNGIPPSVSKRINFHVNFEPTIKVPSQMVGAPAGGEVIMECFVEASPRAVKYWMKESGEAIFSNEKYVVQEQENAYKMHMQLKIRYLERKDFGEYKCLARNSMGEAEGVIQLHELQIATVRTKVDSEDSRISFRIEEHIGGNDSASHYRTLNSKRNPLDTDKEYKSPQRGNTGDGENDVHYPSVKNTADDDASALNCGIYLKISNTIWRVMLCFALTLVRTTTQMV